MISVASSIFARHWSTRNDTRTSRPSPHATAAQPTDIVGVALDRMVPGTEGRILAAGSLHRGQLAGSTSTAIPAGATIYLSDTASGQFSLSGSRAIATAVAPDWIEFGV